MEAFNRKLAVGLFVLLGSCVTGYGLTVSSDVSSETTWALADSPVEITKSDFAVTADGTLSIEAGVTVLVSRSFEVQGSLRVLGTSGARVVFEDGSAGQGWGPLRFSTATADAYRTNRLEYTDLRGMDSYLYVSGQSLTMKHCSMATTSSGWYGMACYVNTASGNPATMSMVSNVFDITIPRHNQNNAAGIIMDGFPCEYAYNTITVTTTGKIQEVEGIRMYRSNTTAFNAKLVRNTILVDSSLPGDTFQVYGVQYESGASGLVSGNTIRVTGPQTLIGLKKVHEQPIVDNVVNLQSSATNSYGYLDGIITQATALKTNDYIVNNRIDIDTEASSRFISGITCQEGLVRGNRIRIVHGGDSGYVRGIQQIYYEGHLDGNTVWVHADNAALQVYGIHASTHHNATSEVHVRNNLIYCEGSTNSAGLVRDTGCASPVSNEYNLVYGFNVAYANCSAGTGALEQDPLFLDTNLHLSASSPAVNAGTNQYWMTSARDIDRDVRIGQEVVDIGCDEYGVVVTLSSGASYVVNQGFQVDINFSEDVFCFEAEDIIVQNGGVFAFGQTSHSNYFTLITTADPGLITVSISPGAASNMVSVGSSGSEPLVRMYTRVLPDLTICNIAPRTNEFYANTTFDVVVTVSNAGFTTGDAFELSGWADQSSVVVTGQVADVTTQVGVQRAGQIRNVLFRGLETGRRSGERTLRFFVDSLGEITESNEENNQETYTYMVSGTNAPFSLSAFALTNSVVLRWPQPQACGYLTDDVQLRYHSARYPTATNDGTLCYNGTNQSYTHADLSPGVSYYYSIWISDDGTNYVTP